MGTITSFPINTTKIDELPIYGAIDLDAVKKDLFEVSKNEGTSSAPVYNVGGSRKITGSELISSLGLATSREAITVTVLDDTNNGSDSITDVTIGPANDNDYFRLEIIRRTYTDLGFCRFRLLLPTTPRNGFSFMCSFDSNGVNKNNFDDYTFSSGYTYTITWSTSEAKWFYDKQKNVQDSKPNYIFNNMAGLYPIPVHNVGVYYIEYRNTGTQYTLALPLLRVNTNEEITFITVNNMSDYFSESDTPLKFIGSFDSLLSITDSIFPNIGGFYIAPPLCKAGSSFTFKSIVDVIFDSSTNPNRTSFSGWKLTHSNIIL